MPNVYVLFEFNLDVKSKISRKFDRGTWVFKGVVTDSCLAMSWVCVDTDNRKYYLVDTDYCEKEIQRDLDGRVVTDDVK